MGNQLVASASEALYLTDILLKEDDEDWEASREVAMDSPPADAMAASELQAAADTMPPKAPQVQVSTQISIDAADYLPLGDVTQEEHPADTEAASKLLKSIGVKKDQAA